VLQVQRGGRVDVTRGAQLIEGWRGSVRVPFHLWTAQH
jgi:hypothetical protein